MVIPKIRNWKGRKPVKNKYRWTVSRQLELLVRNEPETSLPESNKRDLINALAELVIERARHQNDEEVTRDERKDNH
jgi:CYTH domain-containing protein